MMSDDTVEITFIGGPLDLTRITIQARRVHEYYRHLEIPRDIGGSGMIPVKPEVPRAWPTKEHIYQLIPVTLPITHKRIFVGLHMEIR